MHASLMDESRAELVCVAFVTLCEIYIQHVGGRKIQVVFSHERRRATIYSRIGRRAKKHCDDLILLYEEFKILPV